MQQRAHNRRAILLHRCAELLWLCSNDFPPVDNKLSEIFSGDSHRSKVIYRLWSFECFGHFGHLHICVEAWQRTCTECEPLGSSQSRIRVMDSLFAVCVRSDPSRDRLPLYWQVKIRACAGIVFRIPYSGVSSARIQQPDRAQCTVCVRASRANTRREL